MWTRWWRCGTNESDEESVTALSQFLAGEVFKPFYRPELARQREKGGIGLGLAIVRTCIEACGGTVECHNRSPKGLEVLIRLTAP